MPSTVFPICRCRTACAEGCPLDGRRMACDGGQCSSLPRDLSIFRSIARPHWLELARPPRLSTSKAGSVTKPRKDINEPTVIPSQNGCSTIRLGYRVQFPAAVSTRHLATGFSATGDAAQNGSGYRDLRLTKRLSTAREITAASVNGSTTTNANHGPECNRAGHIARATAGG